jgi:hypothetical protein
MHSCSKRPEKSKAVKLYEPLIYINRERSMKNRIKLGYFIVIVLSMIVVGLFVGCSPSNQKVDEAGQYVLKVLNVKYKKEFVINSGHYIANTGGYEFKVHPKNDPDFTFNAWLNGMTESGESDEYYISKIFYSAIKMTRPYIDTISKDNYFSAAAVEPNPLLPDYKEMVAVIHNNNYSIEQMLSAYPGEISIILQIHINYNITTKNEDSVLKKVYKLIEFLKEKKFGVIQISLYFYDFPNKSIKKLGSNDVNFTGNYIDKYKYFLGFGTKDLKEINNYSDLRKYLEKYKKFNVEEFIKNGK